jgi:ferric-dicitrate binding protein FerR (iron transport regulator)
MAKQTFTAGQVLTAAQMNTLQATAGWNLDTNTQTGTTYTLVIGDVGEYVTLNNASAITLTVPDAIFSAGDTVNIVQLGAGQVTIAAGAGVTVNSEGAKLKLSGQYAAATILFTSSSAAIVFGNLSA